MSDRRCRGALKQHCRAWKLVDLELMGSIGARLGGWRGQARRGYLCFQALQISTRDGEKRRPTSIFPCPPVSLKVIQ